MSTVSITAWFALMLVAGLLFILGLCTGASIVTEDRTIQLAVGQVAQFECKIDSPGSQKVFWEFVDHNITIAVGSDLFVAQPSKYEITKPQDSTVNHFWNLNIFSVVFEDKGSYVCYLEGQKGQPNGQVVYILDVIGAPEKPAIPNLDVTDCCEKAGVEVCGLPLCRTNTSLTDLMTAVNNDKCMENNLVKILLCGQDGRNHVGCCMRRGVSDLCQALCDARDAHIDLTSTTVDFSSCIGIPSFSIRECLMEGQVMLPSQPVDVSGVSLGDGLMVVWKPPMENTNIVTGYRVQYRRKNKNETFSSTPVLPSGTSFYQLGNLAIGYMYEARVMAISQYGASQPSYIIEIATGSYTKDTVFSNSTIKACCQKRNVSVECQNYCFADRFNTFSHPDSIEPCFSELDIMYRCLAGEGNHSSCCQRVQVPDECLPLCQGQIVTSVAMVNCYFYMPLMAACMIEGANFLPSAPRNTHLVAGSVTATSAIVKWDPPAVFNGSLAYVVAWRKQNSRYQDVKDVTVYGTQHLVTGLQSVTVYELEVASLNEYGSSLPELTIVFVTEGDTSEIPTQYNETECCIQKGVPANCLDLCNHTFRLSADAFTKGFLCPNSILPMLQCAGDGRDHTDCCVREGITAECLDVCKLHPSTMPSTDLLPCVMQKNQLSTCFDQGKGILPRSPERLEVMSISESAIVLDWAVPGGPIVTGYQVQFSTDMHSWSTRETNLTHMNVDKLKPDTVYYFRVISRNSYGLSLPTSVIAAYTLPIPSEETKVDWPQYYQNLTDCCTSKQVSAECMPMCLNSSSFDKSCALEVEKVLQCAADGRDHTGCCKRSPTLPEACQPYCRGEDPGREVYSALCLPYSAVIMTCFVKGQGLLPSPPQNVSVASYSHEQIVLQWEAPDKNCDQNCIFMAMLWEGEDSTKPPLKDSVSLKNYTFRNLSPETQYHVTVMAVNSKGLSLPAPIAIVITKPHPTMSIIVSQYPSGVVDQGTAQVRLDCYSTGKVVSISWQRNSQEVSSNFALSLDSVAQKHEGNYTCKVVFPSQENKFKDTTLNIRYSPVPSNMTDVSLFPGLNQDAELACVFKGFPDIITWSKDGQALSGNSKYYMEPIQVSLSTGLMTGRLRVKDVRLEDYGSYTCTGQNRFGKQSVTGRLKNADSTPPVIPPKVGTDVPGCCRARNVSELCIGPICTYTIDINAVIADTSLISCLMNLEDFLVCGADGRDHSSCCTKEGVPEICVPFCAGKVPQLNILDMLQCVQHAASIINCAVNGTQYIPSVPQSVVVTMDYDKVLVTWSPPQKNPEKVHLYNIYYTPKSDKSGKPQYSSVSKSQTSFRLPETEKLETYYVWLEAVNDFGKSHTSEKVLIKVTQLLPLEPQDLKVTVLEGLEARIKWSPPKSAVTVLVYHIDFRALPNGQLIALRSSRTDIRLEKLSPNTKYELTITAESEDGRGKRSPVQHFITGQETIIPGQKDSQGKKQDQPSSKVGLAVGLTIAVILLAAFGVVAVCFYRRVIQKKYSTGNQGTVAFENPRYVNTAKVTGLPGESTNESNQFEFGRLHEDPDDHDNASRHSEDGPATLNLSVS